MNFIELWSGLIGQQGIQNLKLFNITKLQRLQSRIKMFDLSRRDTNRMDQMIVIELFTGPKPWRDAKKDKDNQANTRQYSRPSRNLSTDPLKNQISGLIQHQPE